MIDDPARLGFVQGVVNAEDIARIPGTRWLITSGMAKAGVPGHLYLVDAESKEGAEVFPDEVELRERSIGDAEPPDVEAFFPHGIALRAGDGDLHTLYAVNHGGRESIEVFEVDAREDRPKLAWIGAITQPAGVFGNACAAGPYGGVLSTKSMELGDLAEPATWTDLFAGNDTGCVYEWRPGREWVEVPGTRFCGPNGIEVSPDGRWLYVATATKRVARISLGMAPPRISFAELWFMTDNLKWGEDGQLLVCGQRAEDARDLLTPGLHSASELGVCAARLDPGTLEVEPLVDITHETFGHTTTVLEVDGQLWFGSADSDSVAYVN